MGLPIKSTELKSESYTSWWLATLTEPISDERRLSGGRRNIFGPFFEDTWKMEWQSEGINK